MNSIGGVPISTAEKWIMGIMKIGDKENEPLLADIFSVYLESMLKNGWRGACHDLSTAFYMTLSEYDFEPTLYTGVLKTKKNEFFDHSWVEIKGKIYDFAICYPQTHGVDVSPPIFSSINVESMRRTDIMYGASDLKLDVITEGIVQSTIEEYAKLRPHGSVDMYEIAAEYGSIVPRNPKVKKLSSMRLKEKYSSDKRVFKCS
ncbi:lasso peptide biosynthesis protein [Klebsiella michiganensis]|uniref:lasso peptide biosynthesis protein n=1 Tax=Klebsiella michiganensis TaxID=1134687 RepID=UPI0025A04453|nr:lasso peptide biosynthesis protein [Klebsiella michiganensis]MDM6772272.1 lasso peptide biosynthesis protein [Klebsiella michiganensis]HDT0414632.1 lasso peptide biosynthesis protein [Klebsiella michiganensis]